MQCNLNLKHCQRKYTEHYGTVNTCNTVDEVWDVELNKACSSDKRITHVAVQDTEEASQIWKLVKMFIQVSFHLRIHSNYIKLKVSNT